MRVHAPRIKIRPDTEHATVSPLELFFDLVFVFALTQVTAFMAHDISWLTVLRGVLIIMLLWWAWTGYAWLANVASADENTMKLAILSGMAAMFVLALCIPEAFHDAEGGLNGPVVLAVCYLGFRVAHLAIFLLIAREDNGLRAQLGRFAPSVFGSGIVLLIASQFEGWLQTALWAFALVVDYVGTALGGASGWRLPSPGPLRRAARSDRHHRARRVDRGDRRRGGRATDLVADRSRLGARPGAGLGDVVGLLRRKCAARRASADR